MSMNNLPSPVNFGKKSSDLIKANIDSEKNDPQLINNSSAQQLKTPPNQSLVNTNSNITVNQPVLNSPIVNQTVLNTVNIPHTKLNTEVKNASETPVQATPVQGEFKGPTDLPAYAGIANMSLKSWVAQNNNYQNKSNAGKTQLASLFEAIQGFERKSYEEESEDSTAKKTKDAKNNRRKNLILLSNIFSSIEQSGCQETELIVNISNFEKLGKKTSNREDSDNEKSFDLKSYPPVPTETEKQNTLKDVKIVNLRELFALPKEFPECLRLFANENTEINPKYLKSFLYQRLKIVKENLFTENNFLDSAIRSFIPLLNQPEHQLLLPLLLLYYPLPLPLLNQNIDFIQQWKVNKDKEDKTAIATCQIYYVSKIRGRFLIKFELYDDSDLSVNIQTVKENSGIAKDIERAIEEGMFLLKHPPKLADLNVLLTDEIYKATDVDEELSIISTGPLRLEIIIAAYSTLVILNKLTDDQDPGGLIEMID